MANKDGTKKNAETAKDESNNKKGGETAEELKIKGNECVKEQKYIEAVLHYTKAIKMDPNNYALYSNRSFAFLKMDQHYLALQDANDTIKLQPQWAKGYFRRAQVEEASFLYDEAIISYSRALQLEPNDTKLIQSINTLTHLQKKKIQYSKNLLWICTCVGFVFGIIVVIFDYSATEKPTLSNPLSMVAFTIALAGIGFAVGKTAGLTQSWKAGKSLAPPEDLNTNASENESVIPEKKNKYSKAQARHRYKQGKV